MTSGQAWKVEMRRRRVLTELNKATTAAFERCLANGGHVRSEERVVRDDSGVMRELRCCAVCKVPIAKPLRGWGSPAPAKRGGRR